MLPEIDLLGLPVKTFGLLFALAFLAAGAVVLRRLEELGRAPDEAYELTFSALIGGLVGSRAYYLAEHTGDLADDPLGTIFSGSGLVWYGGAIGGAAGVLLWARRKGLGAVAVADLCAPALAVGYAIGRAGCQVSGDGDYGRPSETPWAMAYPDGVVPTTDEVEPTPIWESLSIGLVGWALWRLRDRVRPGVLIAGYLVLTGLGRFAIEFARRNDAVLAGLTPPQLQSLALIAAGAVALAAVTRRGGGGLRRVPG